VKLIIASTFAPFVRGGDRMIVRDLTVELRRRGHLVESVLFPHADSTPELLVEQLAALRLMDLSAACDRLITVRPPSYVIRHHAKYAWFIHHVRGYVDLWGTPYQPDIQPPSLAEAYRAAITRSDTAALGEAAAVFTNSRRVSERLLRYNGIAARVLYPPLRAPGRFRCRAFGDDVLMICRVELHKRQALAIEAMRHVRTGARLRIFGQATSPEYERFLQSLVLRWGLSDRVELNFGWISELRKVRLLADALAALYIPFDEDSYGYPTLEAFHAGKPVITTADGGGTIELVADRVNGIVAEATPESIGAAIDTLHRDRALARELGARGVSTMEALGISWDRVVAAFTE
jgi:glycosyltransferase involved in cell wall biosynthesis